MRFEKIIQQYETIIVFISKIIIINKNNSSGNTKLADNINFVI